VQVALIRPGPIQAKFVRPYTLRRRGQEIVQYAHPKLEPILARTQGIPIFQEQAMAIAMALAGYTGSEADELRRTMGNIRKEPRLLAALKRLNDRMVAHGIEPALAVTICDDLRSFANYGFPESHAWSFALIAYATAYLKVHYPTDFYLGHLNAWPMGFYTPATLIHEAKRGGVEVRTPCLLHGDWECTYEVISGSSRPALRIGWRFVRGMGEKSLEKLRIAHETAPFTSIADVVQRAKLTRAEVTFLALANAFAAWEPNRHRASWEGLRVFGDSLPFAPSHHTLHHPRPLTRHETIALDYQSTGSSVHGHPMLALRAQMRSQGAASSRELESMRDGQPVSVAGLVVVRQRPSTANGVIFLLLEDEFGFINVIVPSKLVEPNELVVKQAQFMLVQGKVEREGTAISVLGRQFRKLRAVELEHASRDFH
jgi:error-prone DNA polymerase